jgi:hypothetical protein
MAAAASLGLFEEEARTRPGADPDATLVDLATPDGRVVDLADPDLDENG